MKAGVPLFIVAVLTLLMLQPPASCALPWCFATAPLGLIRRDAVLAGVPPAFRLRGHAGNDRAVRDDHA